MQPAPDPKDVQEFQFKQSSINQIFTGFSSAPIACNLLAADKKRGLIYIGYTNRITVFKPGDDVNTEWKFEIELPTEISKISLSCDYAYVAVTPFKPSVLIYDAHALAHNSLQLLHEIRVSSVNTESYVMDIRWNPTVPGMLFTVASDYTVGSFHIKQEKEKVLEIKALERLEGRDVLCAAWSPKGKQIAIGCKHGDIFQLKPELQTARLILSPTPYIGGVISILWISNYQFCAAYFSTEHHINVLIVDAPKGERTAVFTCYEDITYGMPEGDGGAFTPRYYFEHIPEWGVIIAASSGSSEIAVLGLTDNGVTWTQWQLVDSGRAQLPLIRTTESYPVGLAIDKSSTKKLSWGADSTLPHPVPILHIFGTSGQLCSFHMVNLAPNCPVINSPPTELVTLPPVIRASMLPSEISFSLNSAATSTPRPKQLDATERPKAAPISNIFGDSLKAAGFFMQSGVEETKLQNEKTSILTTPPAPPVSVMPITPAMLSASSAVSPVSSGTVRSTVPSVSTAPTISTVSGIHVAPPTPVLPALSGFSTGTLTKEITQQGITQDEQRTVPVKESKFQATTDQKVTFDESKCIRAYLEEQKTFEEELQSRLQPYSWECGTEDERKQLGQRATLIDQFLRDLRETTNSLSSDIAYLKALLLQSFAWVEETKSKNAASSDVSTRNSGDNKISELQRLYYYTQSQLVQATKSLDLEWSEHNSQKRTRIKIPSLEIIYQNLVLHSNIIRKEKSKLEQLTKQWKLLARSTDTSSLNRSISNLHITSPKSTYTLHGNTSVIQARCKIIASRTLSFTHQKQIKLKNLLVQSAPKVIKPVNPSPVQDRLEATLSSLVSLSPVTTEAKNKIQHTISKQNVPNVQVNEEMRQLQNPLASLNSIVARIGTTEVNNVSVQNKTHNKQIPSNISFSTVIGPKINQSDKKQAIRSASTMQKPEVSPFGQVSLCANTLSGLPKSFPKADSISFGVTMQKMQEPVHQTSPSKEPVTNDEKPKESSNLVSSLFSNDSLKDALSSEFSLPKGLEITCNGSSIPTMPRITKTEPSPSISFATPNSTTPIIKSPSGVTAVSTAPSQQTFSFATTKLPTTFSFAAKPMFPTTQSSVQGVQDLTGLSLGIQSSANVNRNSPVDNKPNPVSEVQATSSVDFGKLGSTSPIFGIAAISENTSTTSLASPLTTPGKSILTPSTIATNEKTSLNISGLSVVNGNAASTSTTSSTILSFSSPSNASNTSIFGGSSTIKPAMSNFGFSTPTISTPSIFGGQNTTSSTSAFTGFSNVSSAAPTFSTTSTPTNSSFYSPLSKPTFGESANILTPSFTGVNSTATTTLTFGSPSTVASVAPAFGKPTGPSLVSSPQFSNTTTVSSVANVFEKPITSPATTPFSNPSTSSLFNNMPATSSATSIFGGRSGSTIFGNSTPSSSSASIFGGNVSSMVPSGTASPASSIFSNNAPKPSGSIFGSGPTSAPTSPFGTTTNSTTPTAIGSSTLGTSPIFGGTVTGTSSTPMGGASPGTNSVFGSAGSPAAMSATGPAAALGTDTAFRQVPAFGADPVFGSSLNMFQGSKSGFGATFGTSAFGGTSAGSGGFGGSPTLGGSPAPLGTAMPQVFGTTSGSSTFESLANQAGGLTFGSLAQKSPEVEKPPVGSSFSNWR